MAVTYEKKEKTAKKHPNYIAVFIALALLTATEVAVTQIPVPIPRAYILVPLSLIKAALVALFYMHLRSDSKLFSVVFILGVLFGLGLLISFSLLLSTHLGQGNFVQ